MEKKNFQAMERREKERKLYKYICTYIERDRWRNRKRDRGKWVETMREEGE